jgi:hypothetical protein
VLVDALCCYKVEVVPQTHNSDLYSAFFACALSSVGTTQPPRRHTLEEYKANILRLSSVDRYVLNAPSSASDHTHSCALHAGVECRCMFSVRVLLLDLHSIQNTKPLQLEPQLSTMHTLYLQHRHTRNHHSANSHTYQRYKPRHNVALIQIHMPPPRLLLPLPKQPSTTAAVSPSIPCC